jgi:hypothetical protein
MSEEKIKDINKEAYKQAEKELLEGQVKKVKGYILETLQKLEDKKQEKEKVEEQIRILKLDLEDLRNGRFEKIEERIEKSKVARGISVNPIVYNNGIITGTTSTGREIGNDVVWVNYTSGTYTLSNGTNFYF